MYNIFLLGPVSFMRGLLLLYPLLSKLVTKLSHGALIPRSSVILLLILPAALVPRSSVHYLLHFLMLRLHPVLQ